MPARTASAEQMHVVEREIGREHERKVDLRQRQALRQPSDLLALHDEPRGTERGGGGEGVGLARHERDASAASAASTGSTSSPGRAG